MAVRAAASLCLGLATAGGCSVLLRRPGPRRGPRPGTRGVGAAARDARPRDVRGGPAMGAGPRREANRAGPSGSAPRARRPLGQLRGLALAAGRPRGALQRRRLRGAGGRLRAREAGGVSSAPARLRASAGTPASGEQMGLTLLAFFGLAAFAAVRYSTLIATPPAGRAVLVAACVTAGCALLGATGRLGRGGPALALLRLVLVLGTFALSMLALHVPAHLLAPGQWHHLADRVSTGTHQLSGWLWPYRGESRWARSPCCCRSRPCSCSPDARGSGPRGRCSRRAARWRSRRCWRSSSRVPRTRLLRCRRSTGSC